VVGGFSGLFFGVDVALEKGKTRDEHAVSRVDNRKPISVFITPDLVQ
jgi:hypothetical protein